MDNKPSRIVPQSRFVSGLSDFPKEGLDPYVYQDGVAIDHRHDPRAITLLPRTLKESGSTITDLPLWATTYPTNLDTYIYGNTGNFYKRTTTPTYSLIGQIPSSHGNGLYYYPEDDYVYGTSDSSMFRYGPISLGSPQLTNNWLTAQGGVPTNTNSLQLLSASSQYATAASSASLQITGDLSIGAYIYPLTLPSIGNSMTLVGKWDESGATRGYKLDLYGISGFFGSGSDGSLTISTNTTQAPIDSACSGTSGTQTLSATNASFAVGQVILIHQTQGTGAGQWEVNTIQGYTAGTITLGTALKGTYTTGAQVLVVPQYTTVTVNTGVTWTAKAWNGTVGGILIFLANSTVTVTGTISAKGKGFSLGGSPTFAPSNQGEGSAGIGTGSYNANGNGGGGAAQSDGSGAGGSNGTQGGYPTNQRPGNIAIPGNITGSSDLTTMTFGGQGGGGENPSGTAGQAGGGIVFINGVTITGTGTIIADGNNAVAASSEGAGGAGAGGSVLLKTQTATLGSVTISAQGGSGANDFSGNQLSGYGGAGRVTIDYLTSYTATSTPTLTAIQDNTLVTTTTIQVRLGISNDGTAFEYLIQNLPTISTNTWNQIAVSWNHTTSTATFFFNAVSQGTSVGTKTSISSNASLLYVGANKGASTVGNFFNGLIDDVMIFSAQEGASFWNSTLAMQIAANTPNLQAYFKLNNSPNDATSNANNLTLHASPVYSQNVPYPGPTTRLDIDKTQTGTGSTYTTPTTIIEDTNDEISFTPTRDPQKSFQTSINTVGTGDWTVTIHNSSNNTVASVTVLNGALHTGNYEFIFASPWRTLTNFTNTYHAHVTSTVADGAVDCGSSGNLSTAGFTTYYSFLVEDSQWHPISQMLNQMVVGNERYVATFNGLPASYNPNTLVLPAAYRIRCFALWNEYLAIGVTRGTSITDFDQGRIYFWDGSALTFNFFIDVPEGGVCALLSKGNSLYAWCGYTGYVFQYLQGLEGDKIKRIPHVLESDVIEIYPGAVCNWRTLVRFGVAGSSTSTTINRGVYSWGSFLTLGYFQQLYRESLSFDYPISTGNYGSTVSIGLTTPIQNKLLIGWQDGSAFGIDNVSFANAPAANGSISLLLSDDGEAYQQKAGVTVLAQHLPLNTGESVQVRVSTDRGTYQLSGYNTTVGSTKTAIVIPGSLYNEYQVGADLATTGSTSPTITSIDFERDPNTGAVKLQTQ
jgi:hypothetical protein